MVRAGALEQLLSPSGVWAFVDIGFSNKGKTCGLLIGTPERPDAPAECLTFGGLTERLEELAGREEGPLHVVIEAPLSSAFASNGNPVGRTLEKNGEGKTRYWYAGLGCAVLVAALYLIRSIDVARPRREVRLFEGFVSFKDRTLRSDHAADVTALRDAVFASEGGCVRFIVPTGIAGPAEVASTFGLLGLDTTPPPIVMVGP